MSNPTRKYAALLALVSVALITVLPEAVCAEPGSRRFELELLPTDSRLPREQLMRSRQASQTIHLRRTVTDSRPVSRQRNPELSEEQLVIVAYGSRGEELARTQVQDPRFVRAETLDASGALTREELYLQDTDLTVHLPDVPGIAVLKIFRPRWNGAEFVLEPLGDVSLP